MSRTREGKIEQYFKDEVARHGGLTRKAKWLCRRGCPDQFWAFPGKRHGLAEIKHHAAPDPHQQREIAKLLGAGVPVRVISSFDDVDNFIRSEA